MTKIKTAVIIALLALYLVPKAIDHWNPEAHLVAHNTNYDQTEESRALANEIVNSVADNDWEGTIEYAVEEGTKKGVELESKCLEMIGY